MWSGAALRNPSSTRRPLSLFVLLRPHSNGQLPLDHLQRQRGRRRGQPGPTFQVPEPSPGLSLPLRCLPPPRPDHRLRRPNRQVPPLLPRPFPLLPLQGQVPVAPVSTIAGGGGSEVEEEEVLRVCKVIDELFALDFNMEAILDECGVQLSRGLVVEVLRRFRHAWKPAFRFFNWAGRRPGFKHDSGTYNTMMDVLARTRQFESMVSLLEEMRENGSLTMETFEICIRGFAAGKERKKAVGVFEMMKRYNLDAGVESFNSLLDSLGRAKLAKEAQVLFGKLEGSFVPDSRTYTVLLSGWCRVKNLMEAGRVWNEMVDKGLHPDVVAYNVMIEGLLRCKKRSDAIKLFEVMKAKGPCPDVTSYTLLIRYLCKQLKVDEALRFFDEMVGSGCRPDAVVYTCLITGFGNNRRMDMVCGLLKEMEDNDCPPDGVTYNSLIKLLVSQKMPDDALRMFRKMTGSGIEPTIHSYNMIMKSYFQVRNYEMGHAVWDEMKKKGCCPDDNSYTVLIRGLISEGRSGDACRYLEEMLAKGMKAPQLDYNKFAADFSRIGNHVLLEELAMKMKSHGKLDALNAFTRWAEKMKKNVKGRDLPNRHYNQFAMDY